MGSTGDTPKANRGLHQISKGGRGLAKAAIQLGRVAVFFGDPVTLSKGNSGDTVSCNPHDTKSIFMDAVSVLDLGGLGFGCRCNRHS